MAVGGPLVRGASSIGKGLSGLAMEAYPKTRALGQLALGGAEQGATAGAIRGVTDFANEDESKLGNIAASTGEGAVVGSVAAPVVGGVARTVAGTAGTVQKHLPTVTANVGKALTKIGAEAEKGAGLAGVLGTIISDPISGVAGATAMYAGGGVPKWAGKKLADYGRREVDRVMAFPSHYRGPLTEAM